jgi:hypothetical protein
MKKYENNAWNIYSVIIFFGVITSLSASVIVAED